MDEELAAHLAAACSRSAISPEAYVTLSNAFPGCKLIRLSFGLQNKVMISMTVNLNAEGRTHASYVPIHPTAAAAAVLQNNPVVVVRQDKRSPLWDQEDLHQRENCSTLNVVSMPFYWPPRAGSLWEGAPLAVPVNPAFHPTFGALTTAGDQPLPAQGMNVLLDLAARTGRHVGPHISMLLASLEDAGLMPSEAEAQDELGSQLEEEGEYAGDDGMEGCFEVQDEHAAAEADAILPGLSEQATAPGDFPSLEQQQQRAEAAAATAAAGGGQQQHLEGPAVLAGGGVAIPDWLLHEDVLPEDQEEMGGLMPGGMMPPGMMPGAAAEAGGAPQSPEEQLAGQLRAVGALSLLPSEAAAAATAATAAAVAAATDAEAAAAVEAAAQAGPSSSSGSRVAPLQMDESEHAAAVEAAPCAAFEPAAVAAPAAAALAAAAAQPQPAAQQAPQQQLQQVQAAAPGTATEETPPSAGSHVCVGPGDCTPAALPADADDEAESREGEEEEEEEDEQTPRLNTALDGTSLLNRLRHEVDIGAVIEEVAGPSTTKNNHNRALQQAAGALDPLGFASTSCSTRSTRSGSGGGSTDPPGTRDPSAGSSTPLTGVATHRGQQLPAGLPLYSVTPPRYPWSNMTFQPAGLERAFAAHYCRHQQRLDLAAVAMLCLALLAVAAAHLQASWPSGVGALLLFTPYFMDSRLYVSLREGLLSAALLLLSVFLSSLHAPLGTPTGAADAAAASEATPAGNCTDGGGADLAVADSRALMAGFGICWFVFHTCGLHFLVVAPVVMRLRANRALPVQAASLALALHRLPSAYSAALGRLDTVHVLLLGLLLVAGAGVGLTIAQALESRMREAWMARRQRRAAATMAAASASSSSTQSLP